MVAGKNFFFPSFWHLFGDTDFCHIENPTKARFSKMRISKLRNLTTTRSVKPE